jgi:hypothetical protein
LIKAIGFFNPGVNVSAPSTQKRFVETTVNVAVLRNVGILAVSCTYVEWRFLRGGEALGFPMKCPRLGQVVRKSFGHMKK